MQPLREPLLHFAVAGAILFGGYSWLNNPRADTTAVEPVRISEGDVRWLKQTWSSQWLREPSAEELKGLVDDLLNEKLLAREAEAMGLGEDDTIIRRRLAQKLKFLVEDTAQLAEPSEAELQAVLCRQRHAISRRREGSRSGRSTSIPSIARTLRTDAKAALAALSAQGEAEPTAGDRLLFGDSFDDTDELALSRHVRRRLCA